MARIKRLLCALLCLSFAVSLVLPAGAEGDFADAYLSASSMRFPYRNLHVEVYRRDASGAFVPSDAARYSCQINQITGDAALNLLAGQAGVGITVDYLTDLNRDGIYELLDGQEQSVSDCVTTAGRIGPLRTSNPKKMRAGEAFSLTAQALIPRGEAAVKARSAGGTNQLSDLHVTESPDPFTTLYLVTLHATAGDGTPLEKCYYFQIFNKVILPSDVPIYSWFRAGAEYAMERGFLSGTGEDTFSPSGSVTRSQLAQILWRLGGSEAAEDSGYADIPSSAWYYNAVNWCCQTGLMSGSDGFFLPDRALTREELAVTLKAFAQNEGKRVTGRRSLDEFTDGATVSPWAREGVEWAAGAGFLSGYDDGTLRPTNGITRAEMAVVMRKYCLDLKI